MNNRVRAAWEGRISGCLLGKPVEILSMQEGRASLEKYLKKADSFPLRDYVYHVEHPLIRGASINCCKGKIVQAEQDDDITYTVLALMMLEEHGISIDTDDVARTWINKLPGGATFTAEREAYISILKNMNFSYQFGGERKFELEAVSDNEFNDWIGAQIRIDMYGWVLPGNPTKAAELARNDAMLSHRGCAVECSAFIAALAAVIPNSETRMSAVKTALKYIDIKSDACEAIEVGISNVGKSPDEIIKKYEAMSPIHSLNNLAIVVWSFLSFQDSFDEAVGEAVSAGWDTDCNGATVGGLYGLAEGSIPEKWTKPWKGKISTAISGLGELNLDDLIYRTEKLIDKFTSESSKP